MSSRKRTYKQNCALALALDVIGDRWTLLIVRELMVRPRRFGELLENLPGMGTNLLSERLLQLVEDKILTRKGEGHPVYHLSYEGQMLENAVLALIRWGMNFNERRQQQSYSSPDWLILPLRAYFNPEKGQQWRGQYQLTLDKHTYFLSCTGERLMIADAAEESVASIEFSSQTAQSLASGELDAFDAIDSGKIKTVGSKADIKRFFMAFDGNNSI